MATRKMTLVDHDNTNSGGWFNEYIATSGISDTYKMPLQPITSIGASISGMGYLEFSICAPLMLEANTAIFEQWDGVAQINPAVTGFRAVSTSGMIAANVTVKTFYAS